MFITAHKEYLLEAFRLYAYDYIIKPIEKERVKNTILRIQQEVHVPEKSPVDFITQSQTSRMTINLGDERVFLSFDEIYYLEKHGRHTIIHCFNEKYKTRQTLHDFEQRLGTGFFRSHKSFIINLKHIERVVNLPSSSYYEVKFKNYEGKALLSRDRVKALMNLFES